MLTVFFAVVFLIWLVQGIDLLRGVLFRIPELKNCTVPAGTPLPKISIIFSARNEGRTVGEALRSMLAQDYLDYEVIAVNDRSEDGTLEVLRSFSDPKLKVIDLRELPEGWLGKTHGLYRGYLESAGSWIVFTDADIHFAPGCLKACAHEIQKGGWDHVVAFPKLIRQNFLETVFSTAFLLAFYRAFRPWEARNPKSKAAVGVGAFNLVRREVYEKAGTHKRLALNVIDDVDLGRMMKQNGARQIAVDGKNMIGVEWVSGWRGIFKSLEKNAFAGFNYNLPLTLAALVGGLSCDVLPFAALFFYGQPFFVFAAAIAVVIFLVYLALARVHPPALLAFPLHGPGTLLLLTVMTAAVLQVLRKDGVNWRGTFYPLDSLRRASNFS